MRISIYFVIIIIDFASIIGSVLLGETPQEFFEEGQFITWLSCVHLAVLCGICLCSLLLLSHQEHRTADAKRKMLFWVLCCAGFFFLCADEWFEIHENLDFWLHHALGIKETHLTDRLDDLIVLLYGVLFAIGAFKFYKDVLECKGMVRWLVIALVLFLIMSFFDFLSNDDYLYQFLANDRGLDKEIGIILGTIEDSFKLLAEGAFVIAFMEGFHSTLNKR
ncbi:MAG: hypothetical protein HZA01_16035 [Nitrospinae bacterium]|nr:hypothetical protein [Nitrospinota bacterium]